ncbi:MAG: diguanylate cyclase [Marinicellaceae bacterium]
MTPVIILFLVLSLSSNAKIIGAPPYKTIDIPASDISSHFDMVIAPNNTLFVSYIDGVKVFNGNQWQNIEIAEGELIRKLFLDENRVYVGGYQRIGFIDKDIYGIYNYTNINTQNKSFDSIWGIVKCQNKIYFRSVNKIFEYNPEDEKVNSWNFNSKLGALLCNNQQPTVQDRSIGFKKLIENQWQTSEIQVPNNPFVHSLTRMKDQTYFVLSGTDQWQLIDNNSVINLNLDKQLPHLDNYVSIAALSDNQLVLGSNNGLLTFVNTKTQKAESFQLTNEWIAKIIVTKNSEIVVLTEFEVFYLQWPSQLRIQGKEFGLTSDILHMSQWNKQTYALSSAGVYIEDKEQVLYQHKLFKRLDWTNQEAWWLLPINNNTALLAESHKIFSIDNAFNAQPISETIYPRELYHSKFNPNLVYVVTEFDLQVFYLTSDMSWQSQTLFNQRPISLIQSAENEILISTTNQGIVKIKHNEFGLKTDTIDMNREWEIPKDTANNIYLTQFLDEQIYAFTDTKIFTIENDEFVNSSLVNLENILNGEPLNGLKQSKSGKIFANTSSHFFYQKNNTWEKISLSPYIKGSINEFFFIDDDIVISAYGSIVHYLDNTPVKSHNEKFELRFNKIEFRQENVINVLAIKNQEPFNFDQDSGMLSFDYSLTDIKNHKDILYSYRTVGFNDNWSDYSNINTVNLGKLPASTYSFEVRAKDTINQSYTIKPFNFTVNPPWYLTKIAKTVWVLITILSLLILIFIILKWRERIHDSQKLELKEIINKKTKELKAANKKLKIMAHHDGLTGLSNRLYLEEFIKTITESEVSNINILMIDMDHFKKYNDENGHIAGDEILKQLAQILKKEIQENDYSITARYGGEEFVVILINKSHEFAQQKAEKIRQSIEQKMQKVTASIGIFHTSDPTKLTSINDIYQLIDSADRLLYQAKNKGRNQICSN